MQVRQTPRFGAWIRGLRDEQAKARINTRIRRITLGTLGDVKPVGEGISELRIDYGPGYRLYCVKRGQELVVYCVVATSLLRHAIFGMPKQWQRSWTYDNHNNPMGCDGASGY